MKKGVILGLITLSLLVTLLVSVSASYESCTIKPRIACDDSKIVMGVSDATNAHGEFPDTGGVTGYDSVLCCNFAANTECIPDGPDPGEEPENKIIGLSAPTNAHAEIPQNNNYDTDACYSDLSCIRTSNDCGSSGTDAEDHPVNVLSLSDSTNAHIGNISSYPNNKICCSISIITRALWSQDGFNEITTQPVVPGTTEIQLILKNSGLSQGTEVDFEIYEDDPTNDDEIRTGSNALKGTVNGNGRVSVTWLVTQSDIDDADDFGLDNGPYEFYFVANSVQSPNLIATIIDASICNSVISCSDYDENLCSGDPCERADDLSQSGIDCSSDNINCFCGWNSVNSSCDTGFNVLSTETGETITGECIIEIDSRGDPKGCADDGQITYKLTYTWTGEEIDRPTECPVDPVFSPFSCPAEIQLPFFGFYNFIITLGLIGLIYLIILRRQKR